MAERTKIVGASGRRFALLLLVSGLTVASGAEAQPLGPGMGDPDAGDAPSIGESSGSFDFPEAGDALSIGETSRSFDFPSAADNPSIGQSSRRFMDDPSASDNPSIGETSGVFDAPPAGDAPSIGGANRPFDQPGEGAPYGRLRPFGD